MRKALFKPALISCTLLFSLSVVKAQMITGTWKGKINRQKVEVKIIQEGDSLKGTSYYYESGNNYRRYSIKGYFDPVSNSAVWWDDQLIEERSGRFSISIPGKTPLLSTADFNCPGGGKMMLDGKATRKEDESDIKGDVHLVKGGNPEFEDEWDFVIDNYTVGGNDPDLIDSVANIAFHPVVAVPQEPVRQTREDRPPVVMTQSPPQKPADKPVEKPIAITEKPKEIYKIPEPEKKQVIAVPVPTIEEKYKSREKKFIKEIPVTGDSIELRFYDNAEIDGDSISLFLNDSLLFQHIRLTEKAYSIKLAVSDLKEINELTMVAENMGTIPPNTSYMVAIVNDKRYDAYLASTEGSSAMIKLTRK